LTVSVVEREKRLRGCKQKEQDKKISEKFHQFLPGR